MSQISKLKQPPDVCYVAISASLKIEAGLLSCLESEARRRNTSLDGLLEQIASEYAANKRRYTSRTSGVTRREHHSDKKSGTATSQ